MNTPCFNIFEINRAPTRTMFRLGALLLLAGLILAPSAAAKPAFKKIAEVDSPTSLTYAPGFKRIVYVTERRGKIRVIRRGKLLKKPFLNIRKRVVSDWIEQGLLGLAFPPDYRKTGKFYIVFTAKTGDIKIEEFRRNRKKPLVANPKSRRTVLTVPEILETGGHNGGTLRFLGRYLYISVGDGGNPGDVLNQAQDPNSLRGKILRIDPRPDKAKSLGYRAVAGNPFADGSGKDAVFAYGLRNPHTFSFHKDSNKWHMLIADVGQERYEEINYLPWSETLGANFGWKIYEGLQPYDCGVELCPNGAATPANLPSLKWPDVVYSHDEGCAVISGPVIRDPAFDWLRGRFIRGDFCDSRLYTYKPKGGDLGYRRRLNANMPASNGERPLLNGFGEDAWGKLYLFSNPGEIYKMVPVRRK